MKAVILLNGEPYRGKIEKEGYVVCCDGAYRWAKDKVKIDENLGDFDSLDVLPDPPPVLVYPKEKNATDGEIAIDRVLDMGATSVVIYGGGGGREDHFLGNLHLLYRAHRMGVFAVMVTNFSRIFLLGEGKHRIPCQAGRTLSIVPFGGDAHILDSEGLYYPLHGLHLSYGSTRGISNVAESDLTLHVGEGTVLVIVNEEAV